MGSFGWGAFPSATRQKEAWSVAILRDCVTFAHGTGRKSKFTPEPAQKIIEGVRNGLPITRAGLACGVPSTTLWTWLAAKSDFSSDIKRAEAEFEGECLGVVQAAAPKSRQAAAWLLERRFDYKATQRTEIAGKNGGGTHGVSFD